MKLSDWVFETLADWGVRHVFMVTGGGAMHLNDSVGKQSRIRYICNHHEQACAMAAEGYARVSGQTGVVCVTSGPGGTNAITGVLGAWTDSIPMLVLSGQVKRQTCVASYPDSRLRQLGDQEVNIVPLVQGIAKYARFVDDPSTIRYHLERAWHLATSGRPGPVWLDIPLDVQASEVGEMQGYDPSEDASWHATQTVLDTYVQHVLIRQPKRPVILAGSGIRQAGAVSQFRELANHLGMPVVLSRSAPDLLPFDHPAYCGRGGIDADRAGNKVIQRADLLLVLGSRMGVRQTGYDFSDFARDAQVYHIDIDPAEVNKPTHQAEFRVCCDLRDFMRTLRQATFPPYREWLAEARSYLALTGVQPHHRQRSAWLNPYHFLEILASRLDPDEVIACGNGAAFIMTAQTLRIRGGQRLFFNAGTASMGYDLPAAIGAAFAHGKRVICVAGDGSLQMNIQELATIAYHRLPVKIFVLNNGGYLSIRTTQQSFFGRMVGESKGSGVGMPNLECLCEAYGIPYISIASAGCAGDIQSALNIRGPVLTEVFVDPAQSFEPRMSSRQLSDGRIESCPIDDMYPFLPKEAN